MISEDDYYSFISESTTQKLIETTTYNIAKDNVEPTILDANPEKNIYTGKPKVGATLYLGYNFAFVDLKETLIKVSSEFQTRLAELASDDE